MPIMSCEILLSEIINHITFCTLFRLWVPASATKYIAIILLHVSFEILNLLLHWLLMLFLFVVTSKTNTFIYIFAVQINLFEIKFFKLRTVSFFAFQTLLASMIIWIILMRIFIFFNIGFRTWARRCWFWGYRFSIGIWRRRHCRVRVFFIRFN